MKQTDKRPYEPPVVEVFEIETECCLLDSSNRDNYIPTDENQFGS